MPGLPVAMSADAQIAPLAGGLAVLIDMAAQAVQFSASLGIALLLSGVVCFGLMTTSSHFSKTVRSSRQAVQVSSLRLLVERLRAVAHDPESKKLRDRFTRDIDAASRQLNVRRLGLLNRQLQDLLDIYNECYEVHVVGKTEEFRGFTRDEADETGLPVRACYIIVEARDPFGRVLPRPARTSTMAGNTPTVRWAERVSDEVYERIVASQAGDRNDEQSLFAIKERGRQALVMRMAGPDGQPLNRQTQLTEW